MSSAPSNLPIMPLTIGIAPFPEGFSGDMDETFQQAVQLMTAYAQGQFLTGVILPPNSTLPTSNVGAVFMGGIWYYWDPATNSYQPQTIPAKAAKNFCKNSLYQVQQTGSTFTIGAGITKLYDMCQVRAVIAEVLAVAATVGPASSGASDQLGSGIKYTVGPTLVPTLAATDLYVHEHLIEGFDIAALQGQITSLSFFVNVTIAGTYSVYLTDTGRDSSYVAQFTVPATSAGAWYQVTIPSIPAFPTIGTWNYGEGVTGLYIGIVMACGTQWQTETLNAWQPAFYAGAASNINMLTVVNNEISITGIKFESGPQCTYVAAPPFEDDYETCIRYYWTSFTYQSVSSGMFVDGSVPNTGQVNFSQAFPRRMCRAPAAVPYSYLTHNAGYVTDQTLLTDAVVATLNAAPKGVSHQALQVMVTTGTTNSTINITAIPTTTGLYIGMPVAGSGIPAGATVASIVSGTAITISSAATTSLAGTPLLFGGGGIVTTGTTNATVNITAIPSTSGLTAGMAVSGSGIPVGAFIATIVSSTAITISAAATTSLTATPLAFSGLLKGDTLSAYITADARLS